MKVFDSNDAWPSKVNFIDASNVLLGYDKDQQCCEDAKYFFGTTPFADNCEPSEGTLGPYYFDCEFFESKGDDPNDGVMACFRLTAAGLPDIYLTLSNTHNGYYSHGFVFRGGDAEVIQDGSL